jgi:hypothetical protein
MIESSELATEKDHVEEGAVDATTEYPVHSPDQLSDRRMIAREQSRDHVVNEFVSELPHAVLVQTAGEPAWA